VADPNVLNLRCEGGQEGEEAFVVLPVDRALWETAGEAERNTLRGIARRELQNFIHRETGTLLTDEYVSSLAVMVEDPQNELEVPPVTECEVEFVGGPEDGTRMTWEGARPPGLIRLSVKQNPAVAVMESLDEPYRGIPIANYGPITDNRGFCSRAEDGAWRYEYAGQE